MPGAGEAGWPGPGADYGLRDLAGNGETNGLAMAAGRRAAYLLIGGAVAVGAVFGVDHLKHHFGFSSAVAPASSAPAEGPARIAVEAVQVALGTVVDDINVVGTLQSNEVVVIQSEITGRIARFGFAEGEKVAKGDVLVELDPAILKAELVKARSDLALSQSNSERANTLARQGTGTLRARDEAQAALQAAQANVSLAEARLEKATLRAPFDGKVGLRLFSLGAYVGPGDRIVELADTDPIKVDFRVSEVSLLQLRTGQKISITVDALPGEAFTGEIYAIHPIVDENGRALRLRARVPNPEERLYPGLFARVRIIVEQRPNAMLVPEAALFPRDRKTFVYRVVDGKADLVEVTVGRRSAGQAEILSGLEPGTVVVTAGQQQIRQGTPVEPIAPPGGSRS